MEVICLEDAAFYAILDKVYAHLKHQHEPKSKGDKWISTEEAMQMLRITSKTTLQKYRDEGQLRYTQLNPRVILYDVDSIHEFLNDNSRETF